MEMGNLSCDHHSLMSVKHEEDGKYHLYINIDQSPLLLLLQLL
jgi:hypothetical protein